MRSVAQEMPAEERRTRLLHGLKATREPEVVVDFSHLAHALGMDTAESLIIKLVAMDSLVATPYSKKPDLVSRGMCNINRQAAIDAIERVQTKTAKMQIDKLLKKNT